MKGKKSLKKEKDKKKGKGLTKEENAFFKN